MKAIEAGELRVQLFTALTGFQARIYCGQQIPPIEVITRIEKVFADLGILKALKQSNLVRTVVKGRMTTRMRNTKLELISKLNLVRSDIVICTCQSSQRSVHFDLQDDQGMTLQRIKRGLQLAQIIAP